MKSFILGFKGDTQQYFDESGRRMPVTTVYTRSCYLISIKEKERDGYFGVVLGFGAVKTIKKSREGILKKAGIATPLRFLKEMRLDDDPETVEKSGKKGIKINNHEIYIGDELNPENLFADIKHVQICGISKGKGFAGVVKRHGFAGGPRTHGQSDRERAPGSIGQGTTPGRVYKGKRMAGRMGKDRITVKNLQLIQASADYVRVKGLIPGHKGGLVTITA